MDTRSLSLKILDLALHRQNHLTLVELSTIQLEIAEIAKLFGLVDVKNLSQLIDKFTDLAIYQQLMIISNLDSIEHFRHLVMKTNFNLDELANLAVRDNNLNLIKILRRFGKVNYLQAFSSAIDSKNCDAIRLICQNLRQIDYQMAEYILYYEPKEILEAMIEGLKLNQNLWLDSELEDAATEGHFEKVVVLLKLGRSHYSDDDIDTAIRRANREEHTKILGLLEGWKVLS